MRTMNYCKFECGESKLSRLISKICTFTILC